MTPDQIRRAAALWSYHHRQGYRALTMVIGPYGPSKAHFGRYVVVPSAWAGRGPRRGQELALCGREFPHRWYWSLVGPDDVCATCVEVELKE